MIKRNVQENLANYLQWLGYYKAKGDEAQIKYYTNLVNMCREKLNKLK